MVARALTEAKIERTVVQWAKELNVLTIKLNVRGQRGVPDRLFLYDGRVLFLEFKRPGAVPTPIQRWELNNLRAHGFDAAVTDDIEQAKRLIGRYLLGWCT
jgi:hypothetical protein